MSKEKAVQLATAFACFADLEAACKRGYAPTLAHGSCDELPLRQAKTILARELEAKGYQTFGGL